MLDSHHKLLFNFLKALLLVALLSAIVVALVLTARQDKKHVENEGAITTNGIECAAIGRKIVEAGGSVADVRRSRCVFQSIKGFFRHPTGRSGDNPLRRHHVSAVFRVGRRIFAHNLHEENRINRDAERERNRSKAG